MMFGMLLFLLMMVVEALRRRLVVDDRGMFWSLCRTCVGEEKDQEGREDQVQLSLVMMRRICQAHIADTIIIVVVIIITFSNLRGKDISRLLCKQDKN